MKIIEVDSFEQMTDGNAYFELDGKFYSTCSNCGEPIEISWRRTRKDLERDIEVDVSFCNAECRKNWVKSVFSSADEAALCGYDYNSGENL